MSNNLQFTSLGKVAAVVVIYYPDKSVYDNIMSYLDQVDIVILVDNTDTPAFFLLQAFASDLRVFSIINGTNLGVAVALNQGALKAFAQGCSFLLTMDQDSCATPGMVDMLKGFFYSNSIDRLAIVAPFHLITTSKTPAVDAPLYEECDSVWTSGNLLSLSAYKDAGPFEEELFIDFVDHEYCLRLRRLGYKVIQSNKAVLHHAIGNSLRSINVLRMSIIISNHSALRRYYIMRNRLWVAARYPEFKKFNWVDRRRIVAEMITIFLFEENKLEKFRMMITGVKHCFQGKMGRFDLNQIFYERKRDV